MSRITLDQVKERFGEPDYITSTSKTAYYFDMMIRVRRKRKRKHRLDDVEGTYVVQWIKEKKGYLYTHIAGEWEKIHTQDKLRREYNNHVAEKALLGE